MEKVLKLISETIFPDLNRSKSLDVKHVTKELHLNELKYKNLREMQTMKPEQHMSYIMMVLTGLSEHDLDELSFDDATTLIGIVHKIIQKQVKLGNDFLDLLGVEDKMQVLKDSLNLNKTIA